MMAMRTSLNKSFNEQYNIAQFLAIFRNLTTTSNNHGSRSTHFYLKLNTVFTYSADDSSDTDRQTEKLSSNSVCSDFVVLFLFH